MAACCIFLGIISKRLHEFESDRGDQCHCEVILLQLDNFTSPLVLFFFDADWAGPTADAAPELSFHFFID